MREHAFVMPGYTVDQVVSMAPDAASIKAGRGLAHSSKWKSLQISEAAAWGECQGSGKDPYLSSVDFNGPAFKCTCPSRKFPCKHGLGLMFLLAEQPGQFQTSPPPGWVEERLQKRQDAAQRKLAQADPEKAESPEEKEKREKAKAKRQASREEQIDGALADLDQWLDDMIRQGLATAREQPVRPYESMAARMIDQQAPGLARLVRQCRSVSGSKEDWAANLLEKMGRMRLITAGYRRQNEVDEAMRADLRSAIGWTTTEAEILEKGKKVSGQWLVVGRKVEEEDRLKVQRTWLIEAASGRPALILQFAAGTQPLDVSLVPGSAFQGELAFPTSGSRLRAVVRTRNGDPVFFGAWPCFEKIEEALSDVAKRLAGNPWLELLPLPLGGCRIMQAENHWWVQDVEGNALKINPSCPDPWTLVALEGGRKLSLFGEWDGQFFLPLSAWAEGRYIALHRQGGP